MLDFEFNLLDFIDINSNKKYLPEKSYLHNKINSKVYFN